MFLSGINVRVMKDLEEPLQVNTETLCYVSYTTRRVNLHVTLLLLYSADDHVHL